MDNLNSLPVHGSPSNQPKKQPGDQTQESCSGGTCGEESPCVLFRSGSQNDSVFNSETRRLGDSGYSSQTSMSSLNSLAESLPSSALITRVINLEHCYKMDHKKRGRCVIINNAKFDPSIRVDDRPGSDIDAANMCRVFQKLKFDVVLLKDQTRVQMLQYIAKIANEDYRDNDCFALVILSHGDNANVYGFDGRMKLEALLDPLKGSKCMSLVGKPKLVFIQACRGTKLDDVNVTDAKPDDDQETEEKVLKLPTEADFLYAFSSPNGYYSFRNNQRGSWFIQAVTEIFEKSATVLEISQLLTRVCAKVAIEFESRSKKKEYNGKKQVPSYVSMLTKELYFR